MPWYKTGTVSVTQNSNAVIGTGTAFIANSRVGDGFRGPDGRWYEVTNIASNTALSISPNYEGPTAAGGFYAIMPVQGYQKDLSDQVRAILNDYGEKLAALGITGNYEILPVNKGGTGSTTPSSALTELGFSDFTKTLIDDANAGAARSTLGAAKSGANNDITSITGMTVALSVAQGGTGGKTQAEARTGLGLGGAAALEVGTTAGTVAAGNDSRITGAVQTGSAANVLTLRLNNSTTLSSSAGYLISSSVFFPPGYRSSSGTGQSGSNQWNLFWAGSGMQVWVDGSNTGTIQYTASDERIKEEINYIQDTSGDLSLVESLRPVTYRFSQRGPVSQSSVKRGFIAQDVMLSDSSLVTGDIIEGETKDNITSILSLDSLGLVSYLVGAVQELSSKNHQLESRIRALEQVQ
ncbi:tail fiber domain-containing protein [Pseudomonas iranensis]|uniref:tail fiber domain-containing protein n=1 Tax=Pseudomonas iranensis TaxID=2745503 RepID=UPI001647C27C|nr:tail fiber domain-containing protein [Pseudomonas iranensis]QXI24710.1 tail fiber domain-containing protein [Pseudomonas iranensis]